MSITKHTPGPWKSYAGSIWSESKEIDRSKWSSVVAKISSNLRTPTHYQEADAILIAAAPALLEALQSIMLWTEDEKTPIERREMLIRTAARVAIAKAEGK